MLRKVSLRWMLPGDNKMRKSCLKSVGANLKHVFMSGLLSWRVIQKLQKQYLINSGELVLTWKELKNACQIFGQAKI